MVDRRPLVLLEEFFGQIDGEQVALLDRDGWELVAGLGVVIAAVLRRVGDRGIELIAHIVEIALDGLAAHLILFGELSAIRVTATAEPLVDEQQPGMLRLVFGHSLLPFARTLFVRSSMIRYKESQLQEKAFFGRKPY